MSVASSDPRLRPRRSMLYVPGTNARALEKARALPADGLILDVEDAVLPEKKAEARARIREALETGGFGARELVVRVNGASSAELELDLATFSDAPGLSALLVPKVTGPDDVRRVETALESAGAPPELGLMVMIETPRAVLEAKAIAGASPRLLALVLGTSDLEAESQIRRTADRAPMMVALSWCVLAARAHGLGVIDGVHPRLDDEAGLEAACQQGRDLGFDGKTLIHPRQIAAAHRAFGPTSEEIAEAEAIVAAVEAARARGEGVAVLDGKMLERLDVRIAERRLALARGIAGLEAEG